MPQILKGKNTPSAMAVFSWNDSIIIYKYNTLFVSGSEEVYTLPSCDIIKYYHCEKVGYDYTSMYATFMLEKLFDFTAQSE